jgi:hypothetical protein
MVVYLAGQMAAAAGPLSYTFKECELRIAQLQGNLRPDYVGPNGTAYRDVTFACEWHRHPPALAPKYR